MIGTWFSSPTVWENQRLPPNAVRSGLPNPQHLGTISCFLKQVLREDLLREEIRPLCTSLEEISMQLQEIADLIGNSIIVLLVEEGFEEE